MVPRCDTRGGGKAELRYVGVSVWGVLKDNDVMLLDLPAFGKYVYTNADKMLINVRDICNLPGRYEFLMPFCNNAKVNVMFKISGGFDVWYQMACRIICDLALQHFSLRILWLHMVLAGENIIKFCGKRLHNGVLTHFLKGCHHYAPGLMTVEGIRFVWTAPS